MSIVVVDCETSGLDPSKHSILSIGAVNFFNPETQYYGECRIELGKTWEKQALDVNKFTLESITDSRKMTATDLKTGFLNFCINHKLSIFAGLHPKFDQSFLQMEKWFGYRGIDLHSVAFAKMLELNRERTNLDIFAFCGMTYDPTRIIHHALEDAKTETECFYRLIYGISVFPEFEKYSIPNYLEK